MYDRMFLTDHICLHSKLNSNETGGEAEKYRPHLNSRKNFEKRAALHHNKSHDVSAHINLKLSKYKVYINKIYNIYLQNEILLKLVLVLMIINLNERINKKSH